MVLMLYSSRNPIRRAAAPRRSSPRGSRSVAPPSPRPPPQVRDPSLAGKPVAVVQYPTTMHDIKDMAPDDNRIVEGSASSIIAVSYEARAFGVSAYHCYRPTLSFSGVTFVLFLFCFVFVLTGSLFPIGIEHLIYMIFFCYGSSYSY